MSQGTIDAPIYAAGWSLGDIDWSRFDATKVTPDMLALAKAAALVEYNAADYVGYLKRVFQGASASTVMAFERWGQEETQHGVALARWAEMADPGFDFQRAFARFRAGYRPAHFDDAVSVRGSRRGEMIARCVVECGTSSFYSALRDATEEPVLKEVAGRVAADEFRHYRLFYETMIAQDEPEPSFLRRLWVAIMRVNESDDDELAFAYYCGNVNREEERDRPYQRSAYALAYHSKMMTLYRRHHVDRMVKMIAKAVGIDPKSKLAEWASALLWHILMVKAGWTTSWVWTANEPPRQAA